MADVRPFRAVYYNLDEIEGGIATVVSPPYDVIDAKMRAALLAQSRYNVVQLDLPHANNGDDPYQSAATIFAAWREQGILVQDEDPAIWVIDQEYTGPDGKSYTRRGFFAGVGIEEYGAGRIRPHERTHPGPKEDRLRLTRAVEANLSPIFALYDDRDDAVTKAISIALDRKPYAEWTDVDGTRQRLWRITDQAVLERIHEATRNSELLIADGHHRYETARTYAAEVGGDGQENFVMTCLVSLSDPGLTVFPTHRLLDELDDAQLAALREGIDRDWNSETVDPDQLPPPSDDQIRIGYVDRQDKQPKILTLRDYTQLSRAMPTKSDAYRTLDTAVLETVIFNGALGLSEDDIAHLRGIQYCQSVSEAIERVEAGTADAAFFLRGTPLEQVRAVASAGESMPPKSTYFFPKIPTGVVFHTFE